MVVTLDECLRAVVDFVVRVDGGGVEFGGEIMYQVGIGLGFEVGVGVVRLECFSDGRGFVDEIHHLGHRCGLRRSRRCAVGAVEPREGLHRSDSGELAVHVHRAQQRLVEAGLEFVGDDHHLVLVAGERGPQVTDTRVHAGFGEVVGAGVGVMHGSRERDQGAVSVPLLGYVLVDGQFVPDRRFAGVCDHHRLGMPIEQVRDVLAEVFDDDRRLLGDGLRVEFDPLHHRLRCFGLVDFAIASVRPSAVCDVLPDLEGEFEAVVTGENVEDVALLDSLLHRVDVKRDGLLVG
ncbi:Uncharacterised protein [Mycobacteroides abscessus subsp. abscessus]|nr:Uncharacterised protein [Mycobacteroides abscessus subsp. abscessus]